MDFTVIQTLRSVEEEKEHVAAGRSQTMNSKHLPGPDGKARAADCAPFPIDWNDLERFSRLNDLIQRAAKELGVVVTWGGTWKTLKDYDHWELA
ncbi:M15 family metallopeptidase [Frankia sp. RB7]|nr:M15 family metallopeptidase [Frankia sp. RB7]